MYIVCIVLSPQQAAGSSQLEIFQKRLIALQTELNIYAEKTRYVWI